ncbi:hypothetical protein Cme02nite_69500 [Catellatospora methionotrophica]|uniref:Uncharacterized protein n=1 Tax=Catellatospora methionotrophica TaxID=121620 RepID=A0A8J3PJL8_9ACTN|nr:hypothetical protein [Catellatospora methionotrophica]GIG18618.1 hypothetical protein Cme02nite_69500 [Catellatospora methionotrophica]
MRKRNDKDNPPVTHLPWCPPECPAERDRVHIGPDHAVELNRGAMDVYISQVAEPDAQVRIVMVAGEWGLPSEFLELSLDQAAKLANLLGDLIVKAAEGEPSPVVDEVQAALESYGRRQYANGYVDALDGKQPAERWPVNAPRAAKTSDCKPGRDVVSVKL